ncbi:MAG: AAA family ATPase [Elusimicrobia bacterium]|nr:AAA family ATPase [Elusimicrobiota bacterium]
MSFKNIVGQSKAVSLLKADLFSKRVAESYLFVGPEGGGKRKTALEFVKALNCEKCGIESCDSCGSCKKINSQNYVDLFILDFESQGTLLGLNEEERFKQKELRIEAIRILIQQSYLSPLEGRKRVFIIDQAESLNLESSNALLKVLEESSKNSHWILLTQSSERIISTIRSRCRKICFAPPQLGMILEKEVSNFEKLAEEALSGKYKEPQILLSKIFESKKTTQKKQAEFFLKILTLKCVQNLRADPQEKNLNRLELILQSQEELKKNVYPPFILEPLLFSFCF